MFEPTFDLQSHSLHSDGELPAADVVAHAAAAGVQLLALTDHDTIGGIGEALAAGARHGVRIVPATEISAVDGEYEDLHLLGYGIDFQDPALAQRLADARADRERRAEAMADRLRELGFAIDPKALAARREQGKPVGRPHLAAAVLSHPDNAQRLADEGHADVSSFIPAYLIVGTPGYVARSYPTVGEAIGWIHDAGGVAVWAHPFWDVDSDDAVLAAIDRYRAAGLDGVEVFYVTHTREQTVLLADRCEQLGLLSTGSSDFHGPDHRLFSRMIAHDLCDRTPNLGPIADADPPSEAPRRGICLWLTGLSGSGKSTVARLVARRLHERGQRVEVLDGDAVRRNLCPELGFSREDRDTNVGRLAWVAERLVDHGVIVIVAAISPYRAARDDARHALGDDFAEIFVSASVDACERRDVKGLYARARSGELSDFTGVSDPYERPDEPEIVLDTEHEPPHRSAARVVALVEQRLGLTERAEPDLTAAGL